MGTEYVPKKSLKSTLDNFQFKRSSIHKITNYPFNQLYNYTIIRLYDCTNIRLYNNPKYPIIQLTNSLIH